MTESEAVTKHPTTASPWSDIPCLYHETERGRKGGREGGMVANCLFKMDQITILT